MIRVDCDSVPKIVGQRREIAKTVLRWASRLQLGVNVDCAASREGNLGVRAPNHLVDFGSDLAMSFEHELALRFQRPYVVALRLTFGGIGLRICEATLHFGGLTP